MKNFNLIIILLFITVYCLSAQTPQKMSYQAVIRDASGQLLKDRSIGMQVSVLQGSESGTPVFVERFFPSTNSNGLVTVEIGGGLSINGSFSGINWANGPYFIKTETDVNGGANYALSSTSQLLSIPYALMAKNVENIPSIKLDQLNDVNTQNAQVSQVLKWNGSEWAPANDNTGGGSGPTYTPGQGISISPNNVISNTGDNDNNATNEIQQITLSANVLTLSQNGGSVTLPTGGGGGDNWGTQTAVTSGAVIGNGTQSSPIKIANNSIETDHIMDETLKPDDFSKDGITGNGSPLVLTYYIGGPPANPIIDWVEERKYIEGNGIDINQNIANPLADYVVSIDKTGAQENDVLTFKNNNWIPKPISNTNSWTSLNGTVSTGEKVGIGITQASEKLHVNGNAIISGTASAEGFDPITNGVGRLGSETKLWDGLHTKQIFNVEKINYGFDNLLFSDNVLQWSGHFRPTNSNSYDLGSAGSLWRNIYLQNELHFGIQEYIKYGSLLSLETNSDFLPTTNNNLDLGSSSKRWKNLAVSNSIDFSPGKFLSNVSGGIASGDNFIPFGDNMRLLGSSGNRWIAVWAIDGTINTSDRNLKKNIVNSNYGLKDVMNLKPMQYNWKEDTATKTNQIGFIAQDLLETIPEVVVTHEPQFDPETQEETLVPVKNLGVKYDMLIPILTKAIQEQQAMIDDLKKENESLRKDLTAELVSLKATMNDKIQSSDHKAEK